MAPHAKYGWAFDPDNPKAMVEVEEEQNILRHIVRLREGKPMYSYAAISDKLNEAGIPSKGKEWRSGTVRDIYLRIQREKKIAEASGDGHKSS